MPEYKRKKIKRKNKSRVKSEKKSPDLFAQEEKKQKPKKNKKPKEEKVQSENKTPFLSGLFKGNKSRKEAEETDTEESAPLRVVNGRKEKRKKRFLIVTVSVVLIIIIAVSSFLFLPINIFENIKLTFKSFGSGDYPIDYAGVIIEDCVQPGGYYYVLTDTSIFEYSKGGKELFSYSHGFSSPMLATSSTRAIVYDQGGKEALIFNPDGLVKSVKTKQKIITAAIAMNGAYAIATTSSEYTSAVNVYSKSGKRLYSWNSAKDIINNVSISPFSKKIVVSCLNATGGNFVSKMYVFDFKSADAKLSVDFADNVIFGIRATYNGFAAVLRDKYCYFDWDDYKRNDISVTDKKISTFRQYGNKTLVVYNRENDATDNACLLLSSSGEKICEFTYNGTITDITYLRGDFYIVSDTKVSVIDDSGKTLRSDTCEYGAERIAVVDSSTVALISSDGIKTTEITEEENK